MKTESLFGAAIAALIGFFTGFLALINQEGIALADIDSKAWLILVIGTCVVFLKDLQALSVRRGLEKLTKTGNVHSPAIVGVLAIVLASLALSGCSGTKAAYRQASGIEETAYVLGEHYYALVYEANNLADEGILVGRSLERAQTVVRSTEPAIVELTRTARAYMAVRNAATEADLERAISNAAIALSRLVDVIRAGTRSHNDDALEDIQKDVRARTAPLVEWPEAA